MKRQQRWQNSNVDNDNDDSNFDNGGIASSAMRLMAIERLVFTTGSVGCCFCYLKLTELYSLLLYTNATTEDDNGGDGDHDANNNNIPLGWS
jgi:hypothetical protein